MAVDEALVGSANRAGQGGVIRFYQWRPATISLGYFQHLRDRKSHAGSLNCPVVRRSTGGGAIIHDRELTYSLTLPVRRHVDAGLRDHYLAFHQALIDSLRDFGVRARLCESRRRAISQHEPFLCFLRRTDGDVLIGETKIAGSAQRRHRRSLLQHGSILLGRSDFAPELAGIEELTGIAIEPDQLARRWWELLGERLDLRLQSGKLTDPEKERSRQVERVKFSHDSWINRR